MLDSDTHQDWEEERVSRKSQKVKDLVHSICLGQEVSEVTGSTGPRNGRV